MTEILNSVPIFIFLSVFSVSICLTIQNLYSDATRLDIFKIENEVKNNKHKVDEAEFKFKEAEEKVHELRYKLMLLERENKK